LYHPKANLITSIFLLIQFNFIIRRDSFSVEGMGMTIGLEKKMLDDVKALGDK
jgi:hypothetical protein